jgi:hypothetical protein
MLVQEILQIEHLQGLERPFLRLGISPDRSARPGYRITPV